MFVPLGAIAGANRTQSLENRCLLTALGSSPLFTREGARLASVFYRYAQFILLPVFSGLCSTVPEAGPLVRAVELPHRTEPVSPYLPVFSLLAVVTDWVRNCLLDLLNSVVHIWLCLAIITPSCGVTYPPRLE